MSTAPKIIKNDYTYLSKIIIIKEPFCSSPARPGHYVRFIGSSQYCTLVIDTRFVFRSIARRHRIYNNNNNNRVVL